MQVAALVAQPLRRAEDSRRAPETAFASARHIYRDLIVSASNGWRS